MAPENLNAAQQTAWSSLNERMQEIGLLNGAQALLHWDQQTYMPTGAAGMRGSQNASMASLTHTRFTAPEVGEWLELAEMRPFSDEDMKMIRAAEQIVFAPSGAGWSDRWSCCWLSSSTGRWRCNWSFPSWPSSWASWWPSYPVAPSWAASW